MWCVELRCGIFVTVVGLIPWVKFTCVLQIATTTVDVGVISITFETLGALWASKSQDHDRTTPLHKKLKQRANESGSLGTQNGSTTSPKRRSESNGEAAKRVCYSIHTTLRLETV